MNSPRVSYFTVDLPVCVMYDCYLVRDHYVKSNALALTATSLSNGYIGDITHDCDLLEDNEACLVTDDWAEDIWKSLKLGEDTGKRDAEGRMIIRVDPVVLEKYSITIEKQMEMYNNARAEQDKREKARISGDWYKKNEGEK